MTLSRWRIVFCWCFFASLTLCYTILLGHIQPWETYLAGISLCGLLLSFPAFFLCIRAHPADMRAPWLWFALTALLFFLGDALYAWLTAATGEEPETPSVCDIFYIANTLTCIIGMAVYLAKHHCISITNFSVDLCISIFAAAGIIYIVFIQNIIHDTTITTFSMLVQLAYPVGDIVLVFALFVLFFATENTFFFQTTHILMGIAFLLMFFSDQMSLLNELYDIDIESYLVPLWDHIHLILAIAGLYACSPQTAHDKKDQRFESDSLSYRYAVIDGIRMCLPYIFTFSILAYIVIRHEMIDFLSLWAIGLFLILCLRQIFVLLGNRRLLRAIKHSEHMLHMKNVELAKLNKKIIHDSQVDFLTQLYNRRYIDTVLTQLAPSGNQREQLGVLLLDVDYFKQINDTHGHQVGDRVLQLVADCLLAAIRGTDVAGRFGGDEFIVLMPGADRDTLVAVAQRLLKKTRQDAYLAELHVTLSVGGATWCGTKEEYAINRLLKTADDALYHAKENGRDQHVCQTCTAA